MPEMKAIQQKYKGDRQRLNEELMKFYKENEINPAASCLPMLVQIPVFFALYFVLRNFTKHVTRAAERARLADRPEHHRQVTAHWSGYVLLVVYVGSQVGYALLRHRRRRMPSSQRILFMVAAVLLRPGRQPLPGRPAHVLDDDEPLDGRPGDHHAADGAEAGAAAEALVADRAEGGGGAGDGRRRADAAAARPAAPCEPRRPRRAASSARRRRAAR